MLRFGGLDELPEGFRRRNARALGLTADTPPASSSRPAPPSSRPAAGRARTFRPCGHSGCSDGCTVPATLDLFVPGRPLSTNKAISGLFVRDPAVQRARLAEVGRAYTGAKDFAYAVVLRDRVPTWAQAWLIVRAEFVKGRPVDTDGTTIIAKAVLDGAVAAGLLVDDDGEHVRGVRFDPPQRGPEDGLRVVASNAPLW